jgi:purine-cytosine permease-like protein
LSRFFYASNFIHYLLLILDMRFFQQIAEYLYIKKRDPNRPITKWEGYMHGMNRISILVFLVALVVMIVRLVIRAKK